MNLEGHLQLGECKYVLPKLNHEIEFRDYDIITGNFKALHRSAITKKVLNRDTFVYKGGQYDHLTL